MNNRKPTRQPNTGRSQNPGRRKKPQVPVNKKVPKKRISKRQAEINRRKIEKRKRLIKKQRAEARKVFFNRLVMFLIMFFVMLTITVSLFFVNLYLHDDVKSLRYTYQIGSDTDSERIVRRISYNSLYINNNIYINISELASLYEFIITGDLDTIRFIITDENGEVRDDVKFVLNTSMAYINGIQTRLTNPVYAIGTDIYVPMKFFTDYVSGIIVEYDSLKMKLTIRYDSTEHKMIWFNLKPDFEIEHIPEASLDYDTLYRTDPNRVVEPEAEIHEGET